MFNFLEIKNLLSTKDKIYFESPRNLHLKHGFHENTKCLRYPFVIKSAILVLQQTGPGNRE